jgi:DNA-binding SARP family transcriptional activator/tetratricopeptide (TPR) repeat protein
MLEIRVIGELEVRLGGVTAELPASRRSRALLGWLAIHPGRHSRARLAGLFWPDVLDASARASLRSAMWALRAALGPELGGYLAGDRDTITLAGDGLRVDLREARRLLAERQPAAALALCGGELLQDLDDEWVLAARDELDRDLAAALAELTQQASAAGDPAAALVWARRRAALGPLDESAGAALIEALIAVGDGPGARDAFTRLEHRLGAELGVGVSARTAGLVRALGGPAPRPAGASQPASAPEPGEQARAGGLIGRGRDLAELTRAWRAASGGAGAVVVLTGEGGIGKTRLAEQLQAAARQAGRSPLAVTATAAAGPGPGAPFAVWADALGDLAGLAEPPPDQPWAADLARIVPALGYRAGGGVGAGSAAGRVAGAAADPRLERVRLGEAVVQFLSWAARRAGVLVTLEDLHLADAASLELTAYVGRRLGRLPVLLLLTRRRLPARQDLDAVLAALRSRGALAAEIGLEPLPRDAALALVASTAELPEATIGEIVALAAGSPLLLVETARAAASAPDASPAGRAGLASGLAEAVRLATSGLSGRARLFTDFAAAAGRDLDRGEVAALPVPQAALAAAEALGSGLLRTGDGRTGFRHALLRDAVYQEIPDPVRARLHGELAGLLRRPPSPGLRAGPGSGPGRRGLRAAEVARHLRLAGQDEQAATFLALAARDARRVAAMAEAAGFLAEALEIEPGDPELLVELAEVEAFRGRADPSDQAFSQALEEIAAADSGALSSAWLRRGRWLRGGICHPRESRRSYQNALDVLDREPDADPPARAEALAGMAWAEAVTGDPAVVDELLAQADRILDGSPPGDLLVHDIGVARGHALIRAGQFAASYGPLIAASAAAGRAGRPDMAYSCLSNAASAAACAGELDRALDFADRCLALVVPNGLLRLSVYAEAARAALLRRLGRLAEAARACDAAAGYADRAGLPELDGLVRHERGLLALASGNPAAAAAELAAALLLGAPVSRPSARLRLAEALAGAGRADEAEAELRRVVLEPVGPGDFPATLVARMSRVEGLIAAGRGDPALAGRRLTESRDAWQRIARTLSGQQAGAGYVAALIDLGRPPVSSLVEPARELDLVTAELERLDQPPAPAAPAAPAPAPATTHLE